MESFFIWTVGDAIGLSLLAAMVAFWVIGYAVLFSRAVWRNLRRRFSRK